MARFLAYLYENDAPLDSGGNGGRPRIILEFVASRWLVIISNSIDFLASRVLTGALNGILANAKTMISEVCGKEHEVVGMSLITGDAM